MTALFEFVSGLLDGVALMALALSLGGVACTFVTLRPMQDRDSRLRLAGHALLGVSLFSICVVAGVRVMQLALKGLALADGFAGATVHVFFQTHLFRSGLCAVLLAVGVAASVAWLRCRVTSVRAWGVALLMLFAFMVNEVEQSHAAGRASGQTWLLVATMVHVCGATIWAGGVTHLMILRWCTRKEDVSRWPQMVSRFSPLGIGCVGLIVGSGTFLSWRYVGGWSELIGTSYGNLVLVKIVLFFCVLALAIPNFFSARQWAKGHGRERFHLHVPSSVEVETILAGTLLVTAASLTGLPPSVDVAKEVVAPAELWIMYAPKIPRLNGPERTRVNASELTDLRPGEIGKKEDVRWDRFNHNVSGVIVLAMVVMAFLDTFGQWGWARRWPLTFIGFSILIFVFANPDHWPLGPVGFMASVQNIEVVQHWLAAGVVWCMGWFEWKARGQAVGLTSFAFPLLCVVGGLTLLTHSHGVMEPKQEFLVQSTHVVMGLFAVLLGCARWLELRLPPPYNRVAGTLSLTAMLMVGLVLLFYVNPKSFTG